MALFTGIIAAVGAISTFVSGLGAVGSFIFSAAASFGLSYVAQALSGNKSAPEAAVDNFSIQGTLQAGGDVPRSFQLGYSSSAGSLVYANTWGQSGETPNAYFTQVIALQDLPGGTLLQVWVNGELCNLDGSASTEMGNPILEYRKGGVDHLWVTFYDGTQSSADTFLVNKVASVQRPYESSRVGYGVAYTICTALVDDTLFTGFPSYKFALSGIPLYDISKDSTAGGSGAHRWSDRSTWGGDGDNLPAVQIYNILRGVTYNGVWLYGLQAMTAPRLPGANWITQINKCRAQVLGESGMEPTYRSGGQVPVSAQTANTVEALLTACQGRISEIGGFYKIHLGTPSSPSFSFTDADILSTEEQNFTPFFPLSDSINGITARYPFPADGWNTKVAPPLYRSDLETLDGGRRLLADPSFDFVPYSAQVQRLMSSALEEAQRARRHAISMPPLYWLAEPGDICSWTSARNGYAAKSFRIDGMVDRANLDVVFNLTEVDPADYDWDHNVDFEGVTTGPTVFERPAAQAILAFSAVGDIIKDADGLSRRPAIRLSWDGTLPGIAGVQWEVRLASDLSHVTRDRTDQVGAGSILITQSLLPNTVYGVRAAYIPTSPRDMLWSDWLTATTPNVLLSLIEFEQAVKQQVTTIIGTLREELDFAVQQIADLAQNQDARNWLDKKEIRSQLSARSDAAFAEIEEIRVVAVDAEAALASFTTTVTAQFGTVNASITTNSTAIATLNGYAAAKYSVRLDVNGFATGFDLINAGAGVSAFNIVADKFQIAQPGTTGGSLVPVFVVANVNGVTKLALRGDMIVDGSITASSIAAGAITAIKIAAGSIDASKIVAGSISTNQLAVGGVDILNLVAGAATARQTAYFGPSSVTSGVTVGSITMDIKSGVATCFISGNSYAFLIPSGNDADGAISLYCDGSLKHSWYYRGRVAMGLSWDVTGLSIGSHNFYWVISGSDAMSLSDGYAAVQDLRR